MLPRQSLLKIKQYPPRSTVSPIEWVSSFRSLFMKCVEKSCNQQSTYSFDAVWSFYFFCKNSRFSAVFEISLYYRQSCQVSTTTKTFAELELVSNTSVTYRRLIYTLIGWKHRRSLTTPSLAVVFSRRLLIFKNINCSAWHKIVEIYGEWL